MRLSTTFQAMPLRFGTQVAAQPATTQKIQAYKATPAWQNIQKRPWLSVATTQVEGHEAIGIIVHTDRQDAEKLQQDLRSLPGFEAVRKANLMKQGSVVGVTYVNYENTQIPIVILGQGNGDTY